MFWQIPADLPAQWDPAYLKSLFLQLAQALDYLDEENFPNALTGDTLIKAGTLSGSALKGAHSIAMSLLAQTAFEHTLLAVEPAASTTAISLTGIGPFFHYDPAIYPAGTWTLEASLFVANAAAQYSLDLYTGAAEVTGSLISGSDTAVTRKVSGALTMPNAATDLYLRLATNNSTYAASCKGARLILTP